jgi:putative membrane protein
MLDLVLVLAFATLGVGFGIITGLTPGVHVNNIAIMMLSASPVLLGGLLFLSDYGLSDSFIVVLLCIIIIATSIAHTFMDFIPSTFLGAPEGETALSVLPAHSMLLEGRGYEAVALSAIGSFGAIISAFIFIIPFRYIIGPPVNGYMFLKQIMVFILICICILLVTTEHKRVKYRRIFRMDPQRNVGVKVRRLKIEELKIDEASRLVGRVNRVLAPDRFEFKDDSGRIEVNSQGPHLLEVGDKLKIYGCLEITEGTFSHSLGVLQAVFVFTLAGAFGFVMLNLTVVSPLGLPATVLFPALSGLFGLATLLESVRQNPAIPAQKITSPDINRRDTRKSIVSGSIAGSLVGFLPGLSAGVATVMTMLFRKNPDRKQVIVTLSAINTANSFFVLIALFLIMRARSGAAIVVNQLISVQHWGGHIMPETLAYLLIGGLFAATLSFFLTLSIGKKFSKIFSRLPYRTIVIIIIILIILMVFLFTGFLGLLVLAVSTSIGLVPQFLGIRRSHCMAVLLVPVILMLW